MLSLWEKANGLDLDEILREFNFLDPKAVRAGLACLAEAGLLLRTNEIGKRKELLAVSGDLVSVVIVTYNSQQWLHDCLFSLSAQTFSPLEIIVVDNASRDDSAAWVEKNYPQVKIVRLPETRSLAFAINRGIEDARGKFFLLLNPDTTLAPDAIAEMVQRANENPRAAAIAPKLKYSWATAFLNGLGNYVGAFYWSTDNGLGHLDLGQFNGLSQVPSACFAATLIPRAAWVAVGNLDEDFPLYYEDIEWCYRARLYGHTVLAAPKAVVYHAMGRDQVQESTRSPDPSKLQAVVYGRLRFAAKLLKLPLLLRFTITYAVEDLAKSVLAIFQMQPFAIAARIAAWKHFLASTSTLSQQRKPISKKRILSDHELIHLGEGIKPPLTWRGIPELTWDLVSWHYLPLFLTRQTRPVPEFDEQELSAPQGTNPATIKRNRLARIRLIWQTQGMRGLEHRFWRYLQWKLVRISQ